MNGSRRSNRRTAATLAMATAGAHLSQFAWLLFGARVLGLKEFAAVLAAQALYAVLQNPVDVGTAFLGARLVARGELDRATRAGVVRSRAALAIAALIPLLAFALSGDAILAAAALPFAPALLLFALLNTWESFGAGRPGPMAGYVFARSAVPAVLAGSSFAAGYDLPLWAFGVGESVAIALIMVSFRLRPARLTSAAVRARMLSWRDVLTIGVPSALSLLTTALGVIALAAAGQDEAAAVLGVSMRLFTGLNSGIGILSQSVFPTLAATRGATTDGPLMRVVVPVALCAAAGATLVVILAGGEIMSVFLDDDIAAGGHALAAVIGGLAAASVAVATTSAVVAAGNERDVLASYAAGLAITAAGTLIAIMADHSVPTIAAVAMASGQMATQLGVARRLASRDVRLRGALRRSTIECALLLCAGTVASSPTGAALGFMIATGVLVIRLRVTVPVVVAQWRSAKPQIST